LLLSLRFLPRLTFLWRGFDQRHAGILHHPHRFSGRERDLRDLSDLRDRLRRSGDRLPDLAQAIGAKCAGNSGAGDLEAPDEESR
jgi:hypothetical protein